MGLATLVPGVNTRWVRHRRKAERRSIFTFSFSRLRAGIHKAGFTLVWTEEGKKWKLRAFMKLLGRALVLGALLGFGAVQVRAEEAPREILGRLWVEDVFVEPGFRHDEAARGGFELNRSLLGVRWQQDAFFSARIGLGSRALLNPVASAFPTWTATERNQLSVVEAYGQWAGGYGQIRAGRIPIRFGIESGVPEWDRPPFLGLFRGQRYIPRRDVGVSYEVTSGSFTSFVAGHNGESGENQDDRLWLTGRWSFRGDWRSEVGVSATVARFIRSGSNQEELFRIGNVFAGFDLYGVSLVAEGNIGAYLRESRLVKQLHGYRIDATHPLFGPVGLLAQYEFLDPDHGTTNDSVRHLALGLSVRNKTRTSSLYILGTKVLEEGNSLPNDVLEVVWQLTPWAN